jgi:superfamily II DNA or RNA helicase
MEVKFIQGSTDGEVREKARKAMIKGKLKVIISTAVFREGIDIPNLDVVINACGHKSEIMTLQGVGRFSRKDDSL